MSYGVSYRLNRRRLLGVDVLPFPKPSPTALACGMQTASGIAAHVWRESAKAGDLCLCGRRILPAKVVLPECGDPCCCTKAGV